MARTRGEGIELRVRSADIARVTASLRAAGSSRVIVQELEREIAIAARPVRKTFRRKARLDLPSTGGLGEWVAQSTVLIKGIRGPNVAGVTIVWSHKSLRKPTDLQAIDRGRVRHPLFGNRRYWYPRGAQPVKPKVMSSAVDEHRPEFTRAVLKAVNKAMRRAGL